MNGSSLPNLTYEGIGQMPLTELAGVGEKYAEKLAARGLYTLQDLWLHLPLRYEDRTKITPISQLNIGVAAQVEGIVEGIEHRSQGRRPMLKVAIADNHYTTLTLRFFHFKPGQVTQFANGVRVRCFGTPKAGQQGLEIVHPTYRIISPTATPELGEQLDPVYPSVEGITTTALRKIILQSLQHLPPVNHLELLPASYLQKLQMPSLRDAILTVHQPPANVDLNLLQLGFHPAQQRLVLEELLAHQLSLRRQRLSVAEFQAPVLHTNDVLIKKLLANLPFQLTNAQQRVFAEIRNDLHQASPMLRLVQGDVGSGKTVVAALAALLAVEAGFQVAMAAPTELLAEQHRINFQNWLEPLGVQVGWLAGKVTGKARTQVMADIASGKAQVVVGTHALMQENVVFQKLGLAIVDEQHRFGVDQRLALREKGESPHSIPHQLIMTATPIPRTLAMAAYADLDVSAIDELPPGRTPVHTRVVNTDRRDELILRIRSLCEKGRQVYWVCTLIDENEDIDASAAQNTFELLTAQLMEFRVGLVHGRMKAAEKMQVMQQFKAGELSVLVATTVIEVGVDVPNASVMVIENAERLGLSQLHQLRGRVGRGSVVSNCILLYQSPLSYMAKQRLETMRSTHDGFVIAEKDLELRGPGELLGTKQTGLIQFKIADLARDRALLPKIQLIANKLLVKYPIHADIIINRWIGSATRFAAA